MFANNIALNSRDSISSEKWLPKWLIHLPQFNTLKEQYKLHISHCQFANRVYPVNEYYSKLCFTEDDTTTFNIQLDENNYTGHSLATHLQTLMNDAGSHTYTVTYDSSLKKLQITAVGGVFRWDTIATKHAYEIIGNTTFGVSANTYTSDVPIRLSGTNYVDILSNFQNDSHLSTSTSSLLARIPVDVNFGYIIFHEPANHRPINIQNKQGMLDIQLELRDDHGHPWKLDAYGHLSLELRITGHNKHRV